MDAGVVASNAGSGVLERDLAALMLVEVLGTAYDGEEDRVGGGDQSTG